MNLRPYQVAAVHSIREQLRDHKSTMAVLATGLGKTVLFSSLAADWSDGKVLVLAHREELVFQAAKKISDACGEPPHIEMAAQEANFENVYNTSHVVVGSVQTMCRPKRLKKYARFDFGLVIVDECHHYTPGSQYAKVVEYFDRAKVLGVTATPKRHDLRAMGQVFESVACQYEIVDAVEDGWLVPVHQAVVKIEGLDFSKVRTTAGDLNEQDLEKILVEEKALHGIAAPTVELAGDESTLVFCVSVHHAELMAEILNRYKKDSAKCLHGKTDKEERRQWIEKFKNGEVQFLTNCGIFLEGFDAPNTAFISMARPTKSLPLYTQVVGRGTRALPGVIDGLEWPDQRKQAIEASAKPKMTILDFVGNSGRHRLITSADVLGGKWDEAARDKAVEALQAGAGDVRQAVFDAHLDGVLEEQDAATRKFLERQVAEVEREVELMLRAQSREHVTAEASYHAYEVDPFYQKAAPRDYTNSGTKNPPTERQIRYLVHLGVKEETARGYSKRQAAAVIGKLVNGAH